MSGIFQILPPASPRRFSGRWPWFQTRRFARHFVGHPEPPWQVASLLAWQLLGKQGNPFHTECMSITGNLVHFLVLSLLSSLPLLCFWSCWAKFGPHRFPHRLGVYRCGLLWLCLFSSSITVPLRPRLAVHVRWIPHTPPAFTVSWGVSS